MNIKLNQYYYLSKMTAKGIWLPYFHYKLRGVTNRYFRITSIK